MSSIKLLLQLGKQLFIAYRTIYINHSEDILKCHVGEENEKRSVDVDDALLIELLAKVNYSN